MEVPGTPEEAFIREWTPCSHILNLIPAKMQAGIFSSELCLTCVDAVTEFIALGTNMGLVYWYDRKKGNIQRLRCEATTSPITFVKIVNTVDYMVGAGNADGQVTVFQIPKEHPENVPESLKPKVEPKVERYTIGDLHKSPITAIEWSKNGMRLFSGDKNGLIIMTEIDFYMHLCKSMEIVNEGHEIVALSVHAGRLLVGSAYRAIVVRHADARWQVTQIGTKDRKSLCRLGAVWMHSYARGAGGAGAAAAYCARPGLRVWRADEEGTVHQTLLFKDAISNPLTVAELLNPSPPGRRAANAEPALSRLHVFRERFLVAHDERTLCVLDPNNLTAVAVVDELRNILSVSVSTDEIFVLEGPRSLLRLAPRPDPAPPQTDDPINLMTKSLTTSIQQAMNTVRDFAHIDQTVPYITSVLEQPISTFTNNIDTTFVGTAEECVELPPIKTLPTDMTRNVLESIINEFKGVSDTDEIRKAKSDELQRKLKLYNSIMEKKCDEELIHSSRRTRRREVGSGGSTPRTSTPQREARGRGDVSITTPCVMNVSVYGNIPDQNDDLLDKQIEEKEKILAKMLNLESLSIKTPKLDNQIPTEENDFSIPFYKKRAEENQLAKEENNFSTPLYLYKKRTEETPFFESPIHVKKPTNVAPIPKKDPNPIDLVPKVVKLPNNWNLENIELRLEMKTNGINNAINLMSPDESLDADWEII